MESSACARHKSFQFLLNSSRANIAKTLTASFRIFSASTKYPINNAKDLKDVEILTEYISQISHKYINNKQAFQ